MQAEHRTEMHDPEMARCIAATWAGQASWAGWKAPRKKCGGCVYFKPNAPGPVRMRDRIGRCAKYTQLMFGKLGAKFSATAAACQYWEGKGD